MLFSEHKSINSYAKSSNKNQSSLNHFMNSKAIKDLNLIIPEIELQNKFAQIVEQVEKLKGKTTKIKRIY